jgi:protein arginine N-methyltransferase 1
MADYARRIVLQNRMSEIVEIIAGAMEEVELPEQVDVVMSEWMGHCLLYESMLQSVIGARDRFMRAGGTMFPSGVRMLIAGVNDGGCERRLAFWDDVCGFDLRTIRDAALKEPRVGRLEADAVVTGEAELLRIDLNAVTVADLRVDVDFELRVSARSKLNGFVVWFDVVFDGPEKRVVLTTSPFEPETHWEQTTFYVKEVVDVAEDDVITGRFVMHQNAQNWRSQDIRIAFQCGDQSREYDYIMK